MRLNNFAILVTIIWLTAISFTREMSPFVSYVSSFGSGSHP